MAEKSQKIKNPKAAPTTISKKEKSKLHAEHNEKVCNHLLSESTFTDWVVTTSFYSALHYVSHKIFPFRYKHTEYNKTFTFTCIDTYFNGIRNQQAKKNKHSVMSDLVNEKCPEISNFYAWLFDVCMGARYIDYKVDKEISDLAFKRLQEIKTYCI